MSSGWSGAQPTGMGTPGLGEAPVALWGDTQAEGWGPEPSGVTSSPSSPSWSGFSRPTPAELLLPSRSPNPSPSGLCPQDTVKTPALSQSGVGAGPGPPWREEEEETRQRGRGMRGGGTYYLDPQQLDSPCLYSHFDDKKADARASGGFDRWIR